MEYCSNSKTQYFVYTLYTVFLRYYVCTLLVKTHFQGVSEKGRPIFKIERQYLNIHGQS